MIIGQLKNGGGIVFKIVSGKTPEDWFMKSGIRSGICIFEGFSRSIIYNEDRTKFRPSDRLLKKLKALGEWIVPYFERRGEIIFPGLHKWEEGKWYEVQEIRYLGKIEETFFYANIENYGKTQIESKT